jgi:glycosyltransferase involved in cell wall biosynthesis
MNHRAKHITTYLEPRFEYVDLVGFTRFYDDGTGPSDASPWYKARKGLANLWRRGVSVSTRDTVREIVVRDLYASQVLHAVIDDLWRYLLVRKAITPPYDVAVFDSPHNALLAWLLKRTGKVHALIYDDHDYRPGRENNPLRRRLTEKRERLCVRQADGVISTNALLARLRRQQGAKDVTVIPNGVALSLFASARRKRPHPPTLIYMGNLSKMWDIDLSIEAMPLLLQAIPDVRLLIAGDGAAKAHLRALSQELGVAERVNFLGRLAYQDLPSVLAEADVGIATSQFENEFRKYATPLKLIEYMAAGLPVIASCMGQTELTMRQADAGILINRSVAEFVAAARSLLEDKPLYERYSQAAVAYAAGFDWSSLMARVYQYILDVVARDN